jgi:hypothetical protein
MNRLEDELKRALQRVDPAAGFAERVLARAARLDDKKLARSRSWLRFFGLDLASMGGVRWAAACALCIVLATSGVFYERDMQRRRGEEAKEQLMLALRITGSKLQIAEQSLKELDSTGQARQ